MSGKLSSGTINPKQTNKQTNKLQQSSYNVLDIEQKLNHDLDVLELWSNKWLLLFNSSKRNVVFFSKKEVSVMPKLFFNGERLEFVPVHHHLCLFFSESLSWTNFIDML